MSQHAHSRALNLLKDNGHDQVEAEYIMRRLYDYGFTWRPRDTSPSGTSPPDAGGTVTQMHPAKARRVAARTACIAEARAAIEAAKTQAAEKLAEGLKIAQREEEAAKAAQVRALKVAEVLAKMG